MRVLLARRHGQLTGGGPIVDAPDEPQRTLGWIAHHGLALLVGGVILFAVYRFAMRMTHRVVMGVLQVQSATLQAGSDPAAEQQKRAVTLKVVLGKLVRAASSSLVILVLGVFDFCSCSPVSGWSPRPSGSQGRRSSSTT